MTGRLTEVRQPDLKLVPQTVRPDADAERVWRAVIAEAGNDTLALELYLGRLTVRGFDGSGPERCLVVSAPRNLASWVRRRWGQWLDIRLVSRGYTGVLICDDPEPPRGRI